MNKRYNIDLHTHSVLSKDGGITREQYIRILDQGILSVVAITDHNEIEFAKSMREELGERIIIGEEITTLEGEIIGLFLTKKIVAGLSAIETVAKIKAQNGLVYIPHPFETFRAGLQEESLNKIIKEIDLVEVFNARGFIRGKSNYAERFAKVHKRTQVVSSDAHCRLGIGSSFNVISALPTRDNLIYNLKNALLVKKYSPFISYLCPQYNKILKRLKKQ